MNKVLYTAMGAAKETQLRQAVNTNNIANANSDGFKQEIVATRALHSTGPGLNTRAYAMSHVAGIDATEGSISFTGNASDLTVKGPNWFVLNGEKGQFLSKNLSLMSGPDGQLVDSSGNKVLLEEGDLLVPPTANLVLGDDGSVNLQFPQQPQLTKVGTLKIVSAGPSDLKKNELGQVTAANSRPGTNVSVVVGARQTSNVSTVSAAMETMQLANQFGMNMKIFSAAKGMSTATTRLLGN